MPLVPHDYPWVESGMAFCTTRPAWCLYHDVRTKACLMGFILLGVIGIAERGSVTWDKKELGRSGTQVRRKSLRALA